MKSSILAYWGIYTRRVETNKSLEGEGIVANLTSVEIRSATIFLFGIRNKLMEKKSTNSIDFVIEPFCLFIICRWKRKVSPEPNYPVWLFSYIFIFKSPFPDIKK